MDLVTIIQIAGIVGTFVTIGLVYQTLREMKNQRIASQKPDLIIPTTRIHTYTYKWNDLKSLPIPIYWSHNPELKAEDIDPILALPSPLKLYNVGFGVAKNIELKWTGGYDKTIQQIKDYCYQNSIPIVLKVDERGDEEPHLSVSHDGPSIGPVMFTGGHPLSPQTEKHDFLMPVHITSEGLVPYYPYAFQMLVSS